MEAGCEDLDSVDQTWARTVEIGRSLHEKDTTAPDSWEIVPARPGCETIQLLVDPSDGKTAGHENQDVRLRGQNLVPGDLSGRRTWATKHIDTASICDHLGDPMASVVERIKPFEARHAGLLLHAGNQEQDGLEPSTKALD
jgi:hypothetical protein